MSFMYPKFRTKPKEQREGHEIDSLLDEAKEAISNNETKKLTTIISTLKSTTNKFGDDREKDEYGLHIGDMTLFSLYALSKKMNASKKVIDFISKKILSTKWEGGNKPIFPCDEIVKAYPKYAKEIFETFLGDINIKAKLLDIDTMKIIADVCGSEFLEGLIQRGYVSEYIGGISRMNITLYIIELAKSPVTVHAIIGTLFSVSYIRKFGIATEKITKLKEAIMNNSSVAKDIMGDFFFQYFLPQTSYYPSSKEELHFMSTEQLGDYLESTITHFAGFPTIVKLLSDLDNTYTFKAVSKKPILISLVKDLVPEIIPPALRSIFLIKSKEVK